ncbi:hemiasterlin resistant protein 1-like [Punica granatum]|uniref:Hemiasterlin resistant protein 1-like n=2 Tax=Punica granatum TaxID=22663 RepID=A0A6P8D053_PUNGR|nr:hemiasterlin resistant protein 1-like [Punica granatum]PKI61392.1 hypothetical protein CRG98_018240 [Punica granatum]
MPRRSSTGKSAPAARSSSRVPSKPASSPPPAPVQGGNGSVLGGLGATIVDGMAFGTGSALARRVVDAVFGPPVIQHETVASSAPAAAAAPAQRNSSGASDACGNQSKALQECLNNYGSDISKCQFYMDMLQECRRSSGPALGA